MDSGPKSHSRSSLGQTGSEGPSVESAGGESREATPRILVHAPSNEGGIQQSSGTPGSVNSVSLREGLTRRNSGVPRDRSEADWEAAQAKNEKKARLKTIGFAVGLVIALVATAVTLIGPGDGNVDQTDGGDGTGSGGDPSDVDPSCEPVEPEGTITLVMLLGILVGAILVIYVLLLTDFHYMPESVAVLMVGVIAGGLMTLNGQQVSELLAFHPRVFFLYLLPPIIFESGYMINKPVFFSNFGSILMYALPGTIISTFIIAIGLWIAGALGLSYSMGLLDCFLYGSLISAVDPVATIAIFQALNVDPVLHMMVFGESVLNDAVAIVLYRMFGGFKEDPITWKVPFQVLWDFVAIIFGSVAIGFLLCVVASLLYKHSGLNQHQPLELALFFTFAWLPYLIAEQLELSGILAVFFAGIAFSHYTKHNLSAPSQISIPAMLKLIAFMSETAVFAYLGLSVFRVSDHVSTGMIITSIVLCLVGRAANVFPLSNLLNKHRVDQYPWSFQVIQWFSGLRGAIALALALEGLKEVTGGDLSKYFVATTTISVVMFTIVVFGGGTLPLLKYMGIASGHSAGSGGHVPVPGSPGVANRLDEEAEGEESDGLLDRTASPVGSGFDVGSSLYSKLFAKAVELDVRLIRPFLRVSPTPHSTAAMGRELRGMLIGFKAQLGNEFQAMLAVSRSQSRLRERGPTTEYRDEVDDVVSSIRVRSSSGVSLMSSSSSLPGGFGNESQMASNDGIAEEQANGERSE